MNSFKTRFYEVLCYLIFSLKNNKFRCALYFFSRLLDRQRRFSESISLLEAELEPYQFSKNTINKQQIHYQHSPELIYISLAGKKESISLPVKWSKPYDDPEQALALHRFGWLNILVSRKYVDKEFVESVILDWIANNCYPDSSVGWDAYSISERLVNWCTIYLENRHETQIVILESVMQQLSVLEENIEFRGNATNNHIINNGRALYITGLFLGTENHIENGRKLLKYGLDSMFYMSGMHREGSTHYQILMARTYLEILWFSFIYNDLRFYELIVNQVRLIYGAAKLLLSIKPFPYIGDMSPDFELEYHESMLDIGNEILNGNIVKSRNSLYTNWSYFYGVSIEKPYSSPKADNNIISRYLDAGYFFYKTSTLSFVVYLNPLSYVSSWSHGHSDLGSFLLNINNHEVFISTGRENYLPINNSLFGRSISSHNSISVDGREPAIIHGLNGYPELFCKDYFDKPVLQFEENETSLKLDVKYFFYSCSGEGITITRNFIIDRDSLSIDDYIDGRGRHKVTTYFQCNDFELREKTLILNDDIKEIAEISIHDIDNLKDSGNILVEDCNRAYSYGKLGVSKRLSYFVDKELPIANSYKIAFNKENT